MRQCTSVTDRRTNRRTDGLASWHKCEMYTLHLALKSMKNKTIKKQIFIGIPHYSAAFLHANWLFFACRYLSTGFHPVAYS